LTITITSQSSTPVQIFISIRSAGASQIGEILRFCDFFLVSWFYICTVFFSRARTRPGRIRGWIFTVYGSYDVFAQGRSFCGLRQYRNSFGSKNSSKRGVNRHFQAKRAEYKNRNILQSINTINVQCKSWVVRYDVIPNPRWRTADILKIKNVKNSGADRLIFTKFCTLM